MGQYHHVVNMTAHTYLETYPLGCGLKAWEQSGGGIPAALAALIADKPGNMPGDLGHHPMVGTWAGHRLLVVGDYAEDTDIPNFDGPALSTVYSLCQSEPTLGSYLRYENNVAEAKKHYAKAKKEWDKLMKKSPPFADASMQIRGAVEFALSVRFCGDSWAASVPVRPFAERGKDGHLHYVLSKSITRKRSKDERDELGYIWRVLGLGGYHGDPKPDPNRLPSGMERWPWDRPPADLSWHNATDAMGDDGQTRVFANIDRREYFDPAKFGEQPTTAGIMRAADCAGPRMAFDMVVGSGSVQSNVKDGSRDFGSAAALFAMLLHPEPRGGGDIDPEVFPEVGRWRNNRLLLTSEMGSELPSTGEVRDSFTDITDAVLRSLTTLAAA